MFLQGLTLNRLKKTAIYRIRLPSHSSVAVELVKATENATFLVINHFHFSHFAISENIYIVIQQVYYTSNSKIFFKPIF